MVNLIWRSGNKRVVSIPQVGNGTKDSYISNFNTIDSLTPTPRVVT